MYDIDGVTGKVHLSFSRDATCTNSLHSPWEGAETMELTPVRHASPPPEVRAHSCTFPDWARGQWQNLKVNPENMYYKIKSEEYNMIWDIGMF